MPPQKNSGNRGSKKESAVCSKNNRFVQSLLEDARATGNVEDIYIARILKKMGNGRMEAFYIDAKGVPQTRQALIRGSFRGKGKRGVWIDVGSIVVIADSGISGSAEFEIMAVLSHDQVRDLRKEMDIDPRILAIDNTDADALKKGSGGDDIIFEDDEQKEDIEDDVLKQEENNKARPKPQYGDELNIDDI